MVFNGSRLVFHVSRSVFIVFHGSRLVFHCSRSVFIVFHGSMLVFMVFHGSRLVFHCFYPKCTRLNYILDWSEDLEMQQWEIYISVGGAQG